MALAGFDLKVLSQGTDAQRTQAGANAQSAYVDTAHAVRDGTLDPNKNATAQQVVDLHGNAERQPPVNASDPDAAAQAAARAATTFQQTGRQGSLY